MEEVVRRVVSIDAKANEIMKQTEEYLQTKEKDIKDKIDAMRSEIMEKTKAESKALLESAEKEAEAEAQNIRGRTKEECSSITNKFTRIREKLESQLFSRIFK
jgi:vacuolar-type H+-ATPase subunit H